MRPFPGWRPVALRAALYLTLIYSTGLHIIWGPESTIRPSYFNFEPKPRLAERFPDYGSLHDRPIEIDGADGWKMGGLFSTDQAEYLIQSASLADGRPPFQYRFLPTAVAGAIARVTGIAPPRAFLLLNVLCALAAALLFEAYLARFLGLEPPWALLGGVLVVTMLAMCRTVAFAMVDPASVFAIGAATWMVAARRPLGFVVAAAIAVATKEVLAVVGLMWLAQHVQLADRRRLALDLALAAWPFAIFVAIRLAFGGTIASHDGFELTAGELPPFAGRILTGGGAAAILGRTALAFGVLWLGLWRARRHPMLWRHAIIVVPVLASTWLLSLQIARVLGILYVVVIPGFVLLVRDALAAPARA